MLHACSVPQLCPSLCEPSVYGILQARILEWVAISSFGGSFRPKDWPQSPRAVTNTDSGLPQWLSGKKSICNVGDRASSSESGRSPWEGNGNPLQYSCQGNSMDKGAWWATAHGVARVRHDLATKPSRQIRIYGWLPYSCRTSVIWN